MKTYTILLYMYLLLQETSYTTLKMAVFEVILVRIFFRIFPDSDLIRRNTEYISVFSPNAGKCGKNVFQNNSEYGHFLCSANHANKIYPLPSSACFQQHFHDWFYVIRYSSDLLKDYYYLTLTKSVIWQIGASCSPFQLLNMPHFHIRLERLKLIHHGLI